MWFHGDMDYKDLPFPPPEESGSRYVRQQTKSPAKHDPSYNFTSYAMDPPEGRLETWRRLLLIAAIQSLRVEDMPELLLDQVIERVLYDENRVSLHQWLDTIGYDWSRGS